MSLLGNLIWLIFGGFLTGMGYILGGLLVCLTIVGIPFGMQAVKLGVATMTPFGKEIVATEEAGSFSKTHPDSIGAIRTGNPVNYLTNRIHYPMPLLWGFFSIRSKCFEVLFKSADP